MTSRGAGQMFFCFVSLRWGPLLSPAWAAVTKPTAEANAQERQISDIPFTKYTYHDNS